MVVKMEWSEIQQAYAIGLGRQIANQGSADKAYYAREGMVSDREAQPAAVLAEMAVAKMLTIYYSPTLWSKSEHAENRTVADLCGLIEVRRVRMSDRGPAVRSTDRGRVVVAVYVPDDSRDDWREPVILGWVTVPPAATKADFERDYVQGGNGEQSFFRCPVAKLT
jgi:hypothetical protein